MDNRTPESGIRSVLKAALIACAASVLLVVAFAFVLQKQWLGVDSVNYINTGIKFVCAAAAALIAARSVKSRTLLWSSAAGGAYMLITFLVFSLLSGSFRPGLSTLTDIAMCMLGGAVVGMIRNLVK